MKGVINTNPPQIKLISDCIATVKLCIWLSSVPDRFSFLIAEKHVNAAYMSHIYVFMCPILNKSNIVVIID